MNKQYLLCELNDENYSEPMFSQYNDFEKAFDEALHRCGNFIDGDITIEIKESRKRVSANTKDNRFYVTEIKEIDPSKGDYALVWHHAYYGVSFDVLCIGSHDDCDKRKKEEIEKIFNEYDLSNGDNSDFDIEIDNIIDTGEEWEIFSIIKLEKNLQ